MRLSSAFFSVFNDYELDTGFQAKVAFPPMAAASIWAKNAQNGCPTFIGFKTL
jgi:hypothetical protein